MGENGTVSVLRREPLKDDALLIVCNIRYEDGSSFTDLPVIVYPDGTVFTPWDWQGACAHSAQDIPDYDWQLGTTGQKAVMFNGLPRIL